MDEFVIALETEADAAGFAPRRTQADGADRIVARPAPRDGRARSTCIREQGLRTGRAHEQLGRATTTARHRTGCTTCSRSTSSSSRRRNGCANPTRASTRSPSPGSNVLASEAVFLDDLGINLKPAREMGMTTIKVADPDVALAELEALLGFRSDDTRCADGPVCGSGTREPERDRARNGRAREPEPDRPRTRAGRAARRRGSRTSASTVCCRARSAARRNRQRRSRPRTVSSSRSSTASSSTTSTPTTTSRWRSCARRRTRGCSTWPRAGGRASAANRPTVFRARIAEDARRDHRRASRANASSRSATAA